LIGLDYLLATHLYAAASNIECRAPVTPPIVVEVTEEEISYDFNKSEEDLGEFRKKDAYSVYGDAPITTRGLAKQEIKFAASLGYGSLKFTKMNVTCILINAIDLKLTVNPVIYISKNIPKGSCLHDAVMEHELEHVEIFRRISKKYTKLMQVELDKTFAPWGYAFGPFTSSLAPVEQKKIETKVSDIAKKFIDKMSIENARAQAKHDSLEEYESVNHKCDKGT